MGKERESADESKYNTEYYSRHRKSILDAKRKKYQNNPAYRKMIESSRSKWYASKKERAEALGDYVLRTLSSGSVVRVLKIGVVIKRLNITNAIIIGWEKTGVIPRANMEFGTSRCYTDNQYRAIASIHGLWLGGMTSCKSLAKVGKKFVTKWWYN